MDRIICGRQKNGGPLVQAEGERGKGVEEVRKGVCGPGKAGETGLAATQEMRAGVVGDEVLAQ